MLKNLSKGTMSGLRVAFLYGLAGGLWILFSDELLRLLISEREQLSHAQTYKGWVFITVTALILFFLVRRSIQSLQQSQEALNESRRVLWTLLSNLPGMAYRCRNDKSWTMEFVSDGCTEITGYAPSDLILNRTVSYGDLIHPKDRALVWNAVQTALERKEPFQIVYRILTHSGQEKWIWEQGRGVYSHTGALLAVEGFMSDITGLKLAEDALRDSEERYRTLVESTSDAIFMVDPDRHFLSFNKAFLELFGYEPHEVQGSSIRIVHPSEESYQAFGAKAYPVMKIIGPVRTEWHLMRKDGKVFPVEGTYSAIKDTEGNVKAFVGIIRDITARKQTEEELRRYRAHLEDMVQERTHELETAQKALLQKEKLKTLGAISAELAHELRNPIMSIGGFARRLYKKHPDLNEVEIILNEAKRLETILNRIKNYLKPVEMRPEECFVNTVIRDSLSLLTPELERERIAVELDLDPNLPPAYVDPGILAQALINVIRNAIDIMHAGEVLRVRSYAGDQNIHIDFWNPAHERKPARPEIIPLRVDEGVLGDDLPLCFRLLKGMGGLISYSQDDAHASLTITLLKAIAPKKDGEAVKR